ncbi:hypothetical protein LTR64_004892 [Lithohypha guttulata]|uniref:uncharacterized protein n=1 Tax=Lithohypha guttulata TaxID=1690604 RepID=UPI002DDFEC48|nr:hypothetical protein LTR51_005271 [Lithohypha guttulata]
MRGVHAAATSNVNLYCASCDTQIGIFENDWLHLTDSYAYAQKEGTSFSTKAGRETKVVPHGSSQQAAEGCHMAELSCNQCSVMVGQYCRSAPHPSKEHLVDRQFYKLSRTYLKDARTAKKLKFYFKDGHNVEPVRSKSVRSSIFPESQRPYQAKASSSSHLQLPAPSPQQQWSRPSQEPLHSIEQPVIEYRVHSVEHSSPMLVDSALGYPSMTGNLDENGTSNLVYSNGMAVVDGQIKNEAQRLTHMETRTTSNEERLQRMDIRISSYTKRAEITEKHVASCEAKCEYQALLIRKQGEMIHAQQDQLESLTRKLKSLQKNMSDLQNVMMDNPNSHSRHDRSGPDSQKLLSSLEGMVQAMQAAHNEDNEVRLLRKENETIKTHLRATARSADAQLLPTLEEADMNSTEASTALGKRKRIEEIEGPQHLSRHKPDLLLTSEDNIQLPTPDTTQLSGYSSPDTEHTSSAEQAGVIAEEQSFHTAKNSFRRDDSPCPITSTAQRPVGHSVPTGTADAPASIGYQPGNTPSASTQDEDDAALGPTLPIVVKLDDHHRAQAQEIGNGLSNNPFSGPHRSPPINPVPSLQPSECTSKVEPYSNTPIQRSVGAFSTSTPTSLLQRPVSTGYKGPFPDSLNRGQRLGELVARRPLVSSPKADSTLRTPSSSIPPATLPRLAVLQPTQGINPSLSTVNRNIEVSSLKNVSKAEAIDFSDEENNVPPTSVTPPVNALERTAEQVNVSGCHSRSVLVTVPKHTTMTDKSPNKVDEAQHKQVRKSWPGQNLPSQVTSVTKNRGRAPSSQPQSKLSSSETATNNIENDDNCASCEKTGWLLCCDGCPKAYHHRCLDPPMKFKDKIQGDWFCPKCTSTRAQQGLQALNGISGIAEFA